MDKSIKSDRKGKHIFPKIVMYSINVRYPMSEYFHIIEYSDICKIVSQIIWHFYEHVTNVFNMCAIVSTDTNLYTCEICAYGIEYLSGAFLLARVGSVSVVH